MILTLLGIPETALNLFLFFVLGGIVTYLSVSGLSYMIFFVWGKQRFHPTYVSKPEVLRDQIKWGLYGTLGNAVLTAPIHWLVANGYSQAYWNLSDYGIPYFILSVVLYIAFTETWIYWVHRALHIPVLFRWFHKPHHKWRATTSWASMAFHPLDSFAQALPHHLALFLFPVNVYLYLGMLAFVMLWSVMIHDRVSFVKNSIINYTGHHTLHHWYFTCNYGQFFTFWDKLMGTWRDPEKAAHDGSVPDGLLR
ncbi:MAG: sterol desaturase family protein [Sandaracinus sp.]